MTERKKFILRFIAWVFLAFVIPASFLAWRFQLFEVTEETRVKIGGWGLILIIFTAIFFLSLFNQLRKGMKPSIAKQVADGICRITIPLVLCTFLVYWMSGCFEELLEFLIVLTIFETLALPVNPLPKWMLDNNIETGELMFSNIINSLKKKNKI